MTKKESIKYIVKNMIPDQESCRLTVVPNDVTSYENNRKVLFQL